MEHFYFLNGKGRTNILSAILFFVLLIPLSNTAFAAPPMITSQPANATLCAGGNTTFSVTASGATAYQWQVNTGAGFVNISNAAPYSGVITATLTITGATASMNGYQYRVVVTGTPQTRNSENATLTVNTAPAITSHPSNRYVCVGQATSFVVSATGAGLTYQWQLNTGSGFNNLSNTGVYSGVNTATLNISAAGTSMSDYQYRVIVSGTCAPAATSNAAALHVSNIAVVTSKTDVSCNGGNDGTAMASASGGIGQYSFSWSNSGTGANTINLSAQTYTVTVTDSIGCMGVDMVTVFQPNTLVISGVITNVFCNGDSTGAINITATEGTAPYTYSWNSGATAEDRQGLTAGTYMVRVTDDNGCQATNTFTVTESPALLVTASVTAITCNGDSTGAIDVSVSGGIPGYSFSWDNGATTEDLTGLTAGGYVLTVTDSKSCMVTERISVEEPAALMITAGFSSIMCNGDSTGIDITVAGGVGPYSFGWSTGATTEDLSGLTAGTYIITAMDSNSCTVSDTIMITQPAELLILAIERNAACYGDSSGAISITVTGGAEPYSYSWNTGATTKDLTDIAAGTYIVTVTDNNNCTISDTIMITQPAGVQVSSLVTNVTCNGDSSGAIDISVTGGIGPFSYSWNTGATTEDLTGIPAGAYVITVTDSNNCMSNHQISITQPAALTIAASITNPGCNGNSTGSIDVTATGGVEPYSFSWNTGATTEDLNAITADGYILTVTDSNNCAMMDTFILSQPVPLVLSAAVTNATCNGNLGSIDVTAGGGTGPYSFSWSSGESTEDISGVPAGQYIIAVSDSNNCMISDTFMITQPGGLMIAASITNVMCHGDSTGSVNVTVTGGTAPYSFVWSNGSTNEDLAGLSAGAYIVMVTDSSGCMAADTFSVSQPATLELSAAITNNSCYTASAGAVDLTISGGSAPYSCTWSNGSTSEDISGLMAGTYNVLVSDSNHCMIADTFIITQPTVPVVNVAVLNVTCYGDSTGGIDITVTGSLTDLTFTWSNGDTLEDIINVPAGTYIVTVSDSLGCSLSDTIVITQPALPAQSLAPDTVCFNADPFALMGSPAGGFYNGPGISGTLFNPYESGPGIHVIAYVYTDTICGNQVAIYDTINVVICNGIDPVSQNVSFSISPNPADEAFSIQLTDTAQDHAAVRILTVDGKLVYSSNIQVEKEGSRIDVSSLPPGLYMVQVLQGEKVFNQKVVIR
jgi:hypothetical protein